MTFTASNGIKVSSETQAITGHRRIKFDTEPAAYVVELRGDYVKALIESLDHERDEELGRWRCPEIPDQVVYPSGEGCISLSETTGISKVYETRAEAAGDRSYLAPAARAYFDAHPEPKAWHSAAEGDVWLLTINGENEALLFRHDRTFISRDGDEFAPEEAYITAGHRIWPTEES